MLDNPQTRGLLLVGCAGLFWSLQGVTIRMVEEASPAQVVAWRSVGQFFAMTLVITIASRGQLAYAVVRAGRLGLAGGVCAMVAGTSFVFAVANTSIANVVFIMASSPLFAGIGAWLLMRERIEPRTLIAMLVAMGGIGIMVAEGLQGGGFVGYAFAVSTTIGFAGIAVFARLGFDRNMMPMALWGALFNFVLMFVLLGGDIAISGPDLIACLISGGVLTAGGATCFMQGARYVPAAVLAFLSLSETVLAPIWAWLAFAEVPSVYGLVGGAVVLGAIITETALRVLRASASRPAA